MYSWKLFKLSPTYGGSNIACMSHIYVGRPALLYGEDELTWSTFASHKQADLAHAFRSLARLGPLFMYLALAGSVAVFVEVLLLELLLPSLPLLLEALDDVDGAAHVSAIRVGVNVLASARCLEVLWEHGASTGERLGLCGSAQSDGPKPLTPSLRSVHWRYWRFDHASDRGGRGYPTRRPSSTLQRGGRVALGWGRTITFRGWDLSGFLPRAFTATSFLVV